MTDEQHNINKPEVLLSNYQNALVESVLSGKGGPRYLLIAPAGMGKGAAAMSIIDRMIYEKGARNILVLAPYLVLAEQYKHKIQQSYKHDVLGLDVKKYRELVDLSTAGESFIPNNAVIVSTIATIKRDKILEEIGRRKWDLVVIDDLHDMTSEDIERILPVFSLADGLGRMLLMSRVSLEMPLDGVNIIQWVADNPLPFASPDLHLIEYARGEGEIKMLTDLQKFIDVLSGDEAGARQVRNLEMCASSSLNALEQFLMFLTEIKDNDAYFSTPIFKDSTPDAKGRYPLVWSPENRKRLDIVREGVDNVLKALDGVTTDPKLEALIGMIKSCFEIEGEKQFVCIWTKYDYTAQYLKTSLAESLSNNVYSIGALSGTEAKCDSLDNFKVTGGVMILTDAAVQGMDLGFAHIVVHYDLPADSKVWWLRLSRVARVRNTEIIRVYAMHDSLDSLKYETDVLKSYKFL